MQCILLKKLFSGLANIDGGSDGTSNGIEPSGRDIALIISFL